MNYKTKIILALTFVLTISTLDFIKSAYTEYKASINSATGSALSEIINSNPDIVVIGDNPKAGDIFIAKSNQIPSKYVSGLNWKVTEKVWNTVIHSNTGQSLMFIPKNTANYILSLNFGSENIINKEISITSEKSSQIENLQINRIWSSSWIYLETEAKDTLNAGDNIEIKIMATSNEIIKLQHSWNLKFIPSESWKSWSFITSWLKDWIYEIQGSNTLTFEWNWSWSWLFYTAKFQILRWWNAYVNVLNGYSINFNNIKYWDINIPNQDTDNELLNLINQKSSEERILLTNILFDSRIFSWKEKLLVLLNLFSIGELYEIVDKTYLNLLILKTFNNHIEDLSWITTDQVKEVLLIISSIIDSDTKNIISTYSIKTLIDTLWTQEISNIWLEDRITTSIDNVDSLATWPIFIQNAKIAKNLLIESIDNMSVSFSSWTFLTIEDKPWHSAVIDPPLLLNNPSNLNINSSIESWSVIKKVFRFWWPQSMIINFESWSVAIYLPTSQITYFSTWSLSLYSLDYNNNWVKENAAQFSQNPNTPWFLIIWNLSHDWEYAIIESNNNPTAIISASSLAWQTPLLVTFSANQSRDDDWNIQKFEWFNSSNLIWTWVTLVQNFATAGQQTIILKVIDNKWWTWTSQVIINPTNNLPSALYSENSRSWQAPFTVNLNARGSFDENWAITAYAWDFWDWQYWNWSQITHVFQHVWEYDIKLTVTDNSWWTWSVTKTFQSLATILTNVPPVAKISTNTTNGLAPLAVNFSSNWSYDNNWSIVETRWSFDDSSIPLYWTWVSRTFNTAWTYIATLSIKDDLWAYTSTSVTINVQAWLNQASSISPFFTRSTIWWRAPLSVIFNWEWSKDSAWFIASYNWDFGDWTTWSGKRITHIYEKEWEFNVTLTVISSKWNSASKQLLMKILPKKWSLPLRINNQSLSPIQTWSSIELTSVETWSISTWTQTADENINDLKPSAPIESKSPSIQQTEPQNKQIAPVTNTANELLTSTQTLISIDINSIKTGIRYWNTNISNPNEITLIAPSIKVKEWENLAFNWDFGDLSTWGWDNVSHIFEPWKTYIIVLSITNNLWDEILIPKKLTLNNQSITFEDLVNSDININWDHDNKVDINDFFLMVRYYWNKSADTEFLAQADINHDSIINEIDYKILKLFFTN